MWKASQSSPLTQLCQTGYFDSCLSAIPWPFPTTLSPPSLLSLRPPSPSPHHHHHHQYLSIVKSAFLKILFPEGKAVSRALPDTKDQDQRRIRVQEFTGLGSSTTWRFVTMICRTECSKCISACKAEIIFLSFYLFISLSSRLFNARRSFF